MLSLSSIGEGAKHGAESGFISISNESSGVVFSVPVGGPSDPSIPVIFSEKHVKGYQSGSEGIYVADEMIAVGSVVDALTDPGCLAALSEIFVPEAIIVKGLMQEFHRKVARRTDQGRRSLWLFVQERKDG